MENSHKYFMGLAIELAREGMKSNFGGPFGAVIVKDGKVIARGCNMVASTNDPTAHAEIVAIREACKALGSFQLEGCIIYSSCEPCPMCLGAIYWARPDHVFYAATQEDAGNIGFDDAFIYKEIKTKVSYRSLSMTNISRDEALAVFEEWNKKPDKMQY